MSGDHIGVIGVNRSDDLVMKEMSSIFVIMLRFLGDICFYPGMSNIDVALVLPTSIIDN